MHNALYKAPQKIPHNSITLQIYNNFTQITNFSRGKTFYVWFWTGRFWTGLRFCGWGNVSPAYASGNIPPPTKPPKERVLVSFTSDLFARETPTSKPATRETTHERSVRPGNIHERSVHPVGTYPRCVLKSSTLWNTPTKSYF
jgi:hypothetical protein